MFIRLIVAIVFCQETTSTIAANGYASEIDPSCQCTKGDRGEKGYPGVCSTDCTYRYGIYSRECLSSRMNLERLARSIRQLVTDTKVVHRNSQKSSCVCPTIPLPSTPSNSHLLDYNTRIRLKGDKGDPGRSCSPSCMQSAQTNVRVFRTVAAAMERSSSYPDHTYVHIVDEHERLQSVFIRIRGRLVPLVLGSTDHLSVQDQRKPILKPACSISLSCKTLHLFALGPYTRQMCSRQRPTACSKLSEYDGLCGRVSERHRLKGFYRAFMSTSTQWLANLFDGICLDAKIANMQEQVMFNSFEEIFQQKPPQSELLDVQGMKPEFQYWWHGSLPNGTASTDTCLDWSRQDSKLSGMASRFSDGMNGLFHHQYLWPCSLRDSNIGILCIETNCDERKYHKH